MKIVNLQTFLRYPKYTLFSKYEPCCFHDLQIKGDSAIRSKDFDAMTIADAISFDSTEDFLSICTAMEAGGRVAITLDEWSRDGMFCDDQLFAVWEAADLQKLLGAVHTCLGATVLQTVPQVSGTGVLP